MTENVQLVKDIYAAFGRGDIPFILARLAPDVVWVAEGPSEIPWCGTLFGPAEVMYFFEGLGKTNTDVRLDMTVFVAQDDKVATFGRYAATVNGNRLSTPVAHLFVFREGLIVQYRNFTNTAAIQSAYMG